MKQNQIGDLEFNRYGVVKYEKESEKVVIEGFDYCIIDLFDEKVKNNAKNLVRMLLNLFCLYDKGNPLPIK